MANLDRFSQAGPNEYGNGIPYEICYCGAKVYNPEYWGEEYCTECADKQIEKFRMALEDLEDKYNCQIRHTKFGNVITYKDDTSTEKAL